MVESEVPKAEVQPDTVSVLANATVVADKIKQRLLGLLVVSIILLAFVPVIIEDPPTYLDVVPTRVPQAPVIDPPAPLFQGLSDMRDMIDQQITRERQGYEKVLRDTADMVDSTATQQASDGGTIGDKSKQLPKTAPNAVLVPLDFLAGRSGRIVPPALGLPEEKGAGEQSADQNEADQGALDVSLSQVAAGHALSRAWAVMVKRDADRAKLIEQQIKLMAQRIPSYVVRAPVETVGEQSAQSTQEYALMVGPELRREDALKRLAWLQSEYPQTSPKLTVYFPGILER